MENEELKNALLNRRPVIHNYPLHGAVKYSYVSAVIYRFSDALEKHIKA